MVVLAEACGPGVFSKGLKTLSLPAPQDGAGEAPALCAELCACVVCGVGETGELACFLMCKMGAGVERASED